MLINTKVISRRSGLRRDRKLQHDDKLTMALGCATCPQRALCGGLSTKSSIFDCTTSCCGTPSDCDKVCVNHPKFVERVREVGGFELDNVPRSSVLHVPPLPDIVPVLYHGSRRQAAFEAPMVALSLYQMFNRGDGGPRYSDIIDVAAEYKFSAGAQIILTGTADDVPLERWWGIGEAKRRAVIRSLRKIGVLLATTPNYSVFVDTPRWDDLHSIKRIALTHREFLDEGLPAALHVNGRTETDFLRWTDYIVARPEITHLAYEFTTGTREPGRREKHIFWLTELARNAGRPLSLLVRGGLEIMPELQSAFERVTLLETSGFMKTMMRQKAVPVGNANIEWVPAHTPIGEPLDLLLAENDRTVSDWIRNVYLASF